MPTLQPSMRGDLMRSACLVAVLLVGACAWADEAEDAFNSLFGAEYQKVTASPLTVDDAELAGRIVEAARRSGDSPALAALLCEKAYELGAKHARGYAAAVDAMELLAAQAPDKRLTCLDKIAALRQREFAAARKPQERTAAGSAYIDALLAAAEAQVQRGDDAEAGRLGKKALATAKAIGWDPGDVQRRLDACTERARLARRVAYLQAKVNANLQDAKSRGELVPLLLVEADDPVEANRYLDESCDEAMRKYLPVVVQGVQETPELACREIADWYLGLAAGPSVSAAAKAAMLRRARAYYARFLEVHRATDTARGEAATALRRVEEDLGKATLTTALKTLGPDQWIDLVPLADPVRDAVRGVWRREGDGLLCGKSELARIAVPLAVEGSYEMSLKIARIEGEMDVGVYLPAGTQGSLLLLNSADGGCDLTRIAGPRLKEVSLKLDNGRDYQLDIRVMLTSDQAEITVGLDGNDLLHWKGPQSALSVFDEYRLAAPRCPGLAGNWSVFVFKSARLRMLSGKARVLR